MTTEEKIDQMIEVLTAYKEGKRIEARPKIDCLYTPYIWKDCAPVWDFANNDYRIQEPEEKIAMPATDEEITKILSWDIVMKSKNDGTLAVTVGYIKEECKEHFPNYYTLNPKTKCWEDWS